MRKYIPLTHEGYTQLREQVASCTLTESQRLNLYAIMEQPEFEQLLLVNNNIKQTLPSGDTYKDVTVCYYANGHLCAVRLRWKGEAKHLLPQTARRFAKLAREGLPGYRAPRSQGRTIARPITQAAQERHAHIAQAKANYAQAKAQADTAKAPAIAHIAAVDAWLAVQRTLLDAVLSGSPQQPNDATKGV